MSDENAFKAFLEGMSPVVVIYGVYVNRDMTEGRGPMELSSLFVSEDEAWKAADQISGVMGHRPESGSWRTHKGSGEVNVRPLSLFAKAEDLTKEKLIQEREAALKKLSPRERQILGLNETIGRIGGRAGDMI